jgi:hypothetical protein
MTQEITALGNEINERNQTIREKVIDLFEIYLFEILSIQLDRIGDLELKNQELEKFQYVLNYKIDELSRLIHPREVEIDRMKDQLVEVNFVCVCVKKMNLLNMKEIINSYGVNSLRNERKLNFVLIKQFTIH